MTRNDLLREIGSLAEAFSQLGARVSKAARELQESGVPPPERLVGEFAASRKDFADLRARVLELIESATSSPPPQIASLKELDSLLRGMEEAEKKRGASEEVRKRALMILDRVLALTHDEQRDYPPLRECQAKARGLHRAIAEAPWSQLPPDSKALAEGKHPFAVLLTLVEHLKNLDDGQWELLRDTVVESFGKPLAVAASRGKLAIQTGSGSRPPTPRREPDRAAPALERQREDVIELTDDDALVGAPGPELEIVEVKSNARAAAEPARAPAPGREPELLEVKSKASAAPEPVLAPAHHRQLEPAEVKGQASHGLRLEQIPAAAEALRTLEADRFMERLWVRDVRLWSSNSKEQTLSRNSLGWLTSPTLMREKVGELTEFAEEIRKTRHSHVVFLGMGGSSLPAQVFAESFAPKMGFPNLLVLASSDPAAIKQTLNRVHLPHTLFVVASKSGTTLETLALYSFFRTQIEQISPQAGPHFVAITDGSTPLEKVAREARFRRIFLNPPTIGGAYSAISYFGLLPAALIGVDLNDLLARTTAMVERSTEAVPLRENPGVALGTALAALAKNGRDKVSLILSPKLHAFGGWIEQLLAAATGKAGRGLIPVDGEPLGAAAVYGQDRVFVAVTLEGEADLDERLQQLQASHPVLRIRLKDLRDLAAEFFRWEVVAATAATLFKVNPFNEPTEHDAMENTAKLLQVYKIRRQLPDWPVDCEEEGILLLTHQKPPLRSVSAGIAGHLATAKPGDYLALLAYLPPEPEVSAQLRELRTLLRDRRKIATTVGHGPLYLYSTAQLHKDGPGTGLFIQITCDDKDDIPVPGERYSFGALKMAQALGDLEALRGRGRRVIRLHLDRKPAEALKRLTNMLARVTQAR
ncbi:MAG: hypothetical protein ACE5JN_13945 [Candidatus Methylomirabilia bacterium]